MEVLMISPNNYLDRIIGSGKIFAKPTLPCGLLSIVAYLRSKGIGANLHDSYLHNDTVEDVVDLVGKSRPDVVGLSCLTANAAYVFNLGQALKKAYPGIKLVLGNHHASVFARFYLVQNAADVVVHGEGELTMNELCQAWSDGNDISEIEGITRLEKGLAVSTSPRKFIKDLDSIPIPYLDDMDYEVYSQLQGNATYISIASSRGCVNKCKFCAVSDGRRFRARSPENVVREMRFYHERFGVTRFGFLDSLFIADTKRVYELCDLIEQDLPPITWGCEGHVRFMSTKLAKRMAEAGCDSIAFGVESGNQAVLDSVGKGTTLDEIRQAVAVTVPYIPVIGLFIIGLPGETAQTIEETIRFAQELPLRQAQFSMFCPYPGTELYNQLVAKGTITEDENRPEELVASWERYSSYAIFADDAPEPIYITPGLSLTQLTRLHKAALRRFYARPSFVFKHLLPSIIHKQGHMASLKLADLPNLIKSIWKLLTG